MLLSGEAGIGKSRLVAALAERLAAEPHAELRYFCSPYHANSALHPLIAQLERAAGFVSDDSADMQARQARGAARQGRHGDRRDAAAAWRRCCRSMQAGGIQPPKLPAPALRARTLAALARLVEASAANSSGACAGRGRPLDRSDDGRMAGNAG